MIYVKESSIVQTNRPAQLLYSTCTTKDARQDQALPHSSKCVSKVDLLTMIIEIWPCSIPDTNKLLTSETVQVNSLSFESIQFIVLSAKPQTLCHCHQLHSVVIILVFAGCLLPHLL